MNPQSETDGLEFLDQPPPDLTGVDGTVFAAATDIDIRSPLLLHILADKPQASQQKRKKLQSYQRSQNGANGRYIHMSANLREIAPVPGARPPDPLRANLP